MRTISFREVETIEFIGKFSSSKCRTAVPNLTRSAGLNNWLTLGDMGNEPVSGKGQCQCTALVRALPTLVLFQGGREKARTEWARPAVEIERFIDQQLRVA